MTQEIKIIHKQGVDGVVIQIIGDNLMSIEVSGTQWSQRKMTADYRFMTPDVSFTLSDKEITEIDTYLFPTPQD